MILPQFVESVSLTVRFSLFSCFLSLHPIQKNNTIRMIDKLIRYPIYLASALGIASFKTFMSVMILKAILMPMSVKTPIRFNC